MSKARRLVLGTTNALKGHEYVDLLDEFRFYLQTLQDFPNHLDVVEDGDSFAANARKKAIEQAMHLNYWVMADDSGLEVDALNGAPGVYSARYAGPSAKDKDNNARLLSELADIPWEKRSARYYCHIAVADPAGVIKAETWGECRGRIRTEPAGSNGFGYDPLFEIREYHQTFGQLGPHVKAALSHRARALRTIVPRLISLAATDQWQRAQ